MSEKDTINRKVERQVSIIKFLETADSRTNTEILNHLRMKGHRHSTSTLSNDIKTLKESGFMIDDSIKGRYAFIESNCNEFQSHFIKYQSMAIAYRNSMKFSKEDMQCILFEPNALEFNLDVFEPLFNAIREKKVITFSYKIFKNNSIKEYRIAPYVL